MSRGLYTLIVGVAGACASGTSAPPQECAYSVLPDASVWTPPETVYVLPRDGGAWPADAASTPPRFGSSFCDASSRGESAEVLPHLAMPADLSYLELEAPGSPTTSIGWRCSKADRASCDRAYAAMPHAAQGPPHTFPPVGELLPLAGTLLVERQGRLSRLTTEQELTPLLAPIDNPFHALLLVRLRGYEAACNRGGYERDGADWLLGVTQPIADGDASTGRYYPALRVLRVSRAGAVQLVQ